jgi:hypothetical protein
MAKRHNLQQVASILVESAYYGATPTATKYGISVRTLQRWRERLDGDRSLQDEFERVRSIFEREWATDAIAAIKAGLHFLTKAAQTVKASDPAAIHAVAGGIKIASEMLIVREVLDARLSGPNRADDPQD